jgi:hypothetical protein
MFGPWAPNGYLLASNPPFGSLFFIRLLAMFGLSCSERLPACVDSASRCYIFFIHLLAMFGPWAPNGYLLASIPPLGDIYVNPHMRTISLCVRGLPICEFFWIPTHSHMGTPLRGPVSDVALTRQRSYVESRVNQNFLVVSAHTQAHTNIKKQVL